MPLATGHRELATEWLPALRGARNVRTIMLKHWSRCGAAIVLAARCLHALTPARMQTFALRHTTGLIAPKVKAEAVKYLGRASGRLRGARLRGRVAQGLPKRRSGSGECVPGGLDRRRFGEGTDACGKPLRWHVGSETDELSGYALSFFSAAFFAAAAVQGGTTPFIRA